MSKVKVLSPEVVSKIAAGEVVQRPASIIKELVENSLDARSGSIEIDMQQGGKTFIRVKDNGQGIEQADLAKVFLRHSTSKISGISDLLTLNSLGFRGEALYSIAAVSDIILRSKTETQDSGWEIHLRGGKVLNQIPVTMNQGTEIEIKEVFFNTPARKKFLKSDVTELNQVLNVFIPYTLLLPGISFRLINQPKTRVNVEPEENHIDRIAKILRLNPGDIIEIREKLSNYPAELKIFLGDINIQRPKKNIQFSFINNRPVHNHLIGYHINRAYRSILPPDVYSFFAVFINMPGENLDVNIHPTKREVKIKNEHILLSSINNICEKALLKRSAPKQIKSLRSEPREENRPIPSAVNHRDNPPFNQQELFIPPDNYRVSGGQPAVGYREENLKDKLLNGRYIGSFLKKYLLFESGTCLLVLDQHAAQERVTYEQFIEQIESGKIESQRLISPKILKVTPQEMLLWDILKEKFEQLGFSTSLWDNDSVAMHSYPQILKNPENSLRNLISGEERSKFDPETLARRACRASIMAGYDMSPEQALYLKNRLIKCKDPLTCPHGRPTAIEIKDIVLEKQFNRR